MRQTTRAHRPSLAISIRVHARGKNIHPACIRALFVIVQSGRTARANLRESALTDPRPSWPASALGFFSGLQNVACRRGSRRNRRRVWPAQRGCPRARRPREMIRIPLPPAYRGRDYGSPSFADHIRRCNRPARTAGCSFPLEVLFAGGTAFACSRITRRHAAPHTSTVSIEQLVGWLLIAAGFIVSATIIRKHHLPSSWWPLSSSVIAMALGVLLVRSPIEGVIALTIVMVALFFIKGIASIVIALACRPNVDNWIWTLLGGLVTLMVAFLMSKSWPSTTAWGLGLYVGINMIYLGAWLILTVIAARGIDSARGM